MKKFSALLGLAALGSLAGLAVKKLRPPSPPEGAWRDVATTPSTNGSQPD